MRSALSLPLDLRRTLILLSIQRRGRLLSMPKTQCLGTGLRSSLDLGSSC